MYPEYSNSRAYGFPVRCVQHLRLLFSRDFNAFVRFAGASGGLPAYERRIKNTVRILSGQCPERM